MTSKKILVVLLTTITLILMMLVPLASADNIETNFDTGNYSCANVTTETIMTFNESLAGTETLEYEGNATAVLGTESITFSSNGTFYNATVIDGGEVIHWYPVEEGAGSIHYDVVSDNYLTVSGATLSTYWAMVDRESYNLNFGCSNRGYFDGSTGYSSCDDSTTLNTSQEMTLLITAKFGTGSLVSKTAGNSYGWGISSLFFGFKTSNPSVGYWRQEINLPVDEKMHKLVMKYPGDGTIPSVLIDSVQISGAITSIGVDVLNGFQASFDPLIISGGQVFSGSLLYGNHDIANVRIYNKLLSDEEIETFNNGLQPTSDGLVGRWENTGSTSSDWLDKSGNNNNATPVNLEQIQIPAMQTGNLDATGSIAYNNITATSSGQYNNYIVNLTHYPAKAGSGWINYTITDPNFLNSDYDYPVYSSTYDSPTVLWYPTTETIAVCTGDVTRQTYAFDTSITFVMAPPENFTVVPFQDYAHFEWDSYDDADYYTLCRLVPAFVYTDAIPIIDGIVDSAYSISNVAVTRSPNPITPNDLCCARAIVDDDYMYFVMTTIDNDVNSKDDYTRFFVDKNRDGIDSGDIGFQLKEDNKFKILEWDGTQWTEEDNQGVVFATSGRGTSTPGYEMRIPLSLFADAVDPTNMAFAIEREDSSQDPSVFRYFPNKCDTSLDSSCWQDVKVSTELNEPSAWMCVENITGTSYNSTGLDPFTYYNYSLQAVVGTNLSYPIHVDFVTIDSPMYNVSGYVYDSITGLPIANVGVSIKDGNVFERVETNINGYYKLFNVYNDSYEVTADKYDYNEQIKSIIVSGSDQSLNFTLEYNPVPRNELPTSVFIVLSVVTFLFTIVTFWYRETHDTQIISGLIGSVLYFGLSKILINGNLVESFGGVVNGRIVTGTRPIYHSGIAYLYQFAGIILFIITVLLIIDAIRVYLSKERF